LVGIRRDTVGHKKSWCLDALGKIMDGLFCKFLGAVYPISETLLLF